MKQNEGKIKNYPSLYNVFRLGDRVRRKYQDEGGTTKEYAGIVLAINKEDMEVYWDTLNGKYMPREMDLTFTNCSKDDIFKGSEHYTPVKKE